MFNLHYIGFVSLSRSNLAVNYIRLHARNQNVYQYHVNFSPVVDSKGMRIGLLNEHKDKMPVKLFDGTIMYLPEKLPQDVSRFSCLAGFILFIGSSQPFAFC